MIELGYDDLVENIKTLPPTWIPAILQEVINRAVQVNIYVAGGLQKFTATAEHKARGTTPAKHQDFPAFAERLQNSCNNLTPLDISAIIEVFHQSCKYCLEGTSRCQCWNDE
jgi:hypothetical protein